MVCCRFQSAAAMAHSPSVMITAAQITVTAMTTVPLPSAASYFTLAGAGEPATGSPVEWECEDVPDAGDGDGDGRAKFVAVDAELPIDRKTADMST